MIADGNAASTEVFTIVVPYMMADSPNMVDICAHRLTYQTMEPSRHAVFITRQQPDHPSDNAAKEQFHPPNYSTITCTHKLLDGYRCPSYPVAGLHQPSENERRHNPCHKDNREHSNDGHFGK